MRASFFPVLLWRRGSRRSLLGLGRLGHDSLQRGLLAEHQKQFLEVIPNFNDACDQYLKNPGEFVWPKKLRVSRMSSAKGIWELTWQDGLLIFAISK